MHACMHEGRPTVEAEVNSGILKRHMLPSRRRRSFQEGFARSRCAWLTTAWPQRQRVCASLTFLQSRSVFYWKHMEHHEEGNQTTTAATDCWAAEILCSSGMDTDLSATISIFGSHKLHKRNLKKEWCNTVVNTPDQKLLLKMLLWTNLRFICILCYWLFHVSHPAFPWKHWKPFSVHIWLLNKHSTE